MTTPSVQYACTADGVNIAHTSFGEGPPVVFASSVWGDVETYGLPGYHSRKLTNPLVASGWQVVRYDIRGMGSSDRKIPDFSLNARILDLEAVIADRGLERFVLAGWDVGTATAIAYAVRHPQQVSRLVLLNPWLSGAARYETISIARAQGFAGQSLTDMALQDWDLASLTIANLETMFDDPGLASEMAAAYRRSTSAENWLSHRLASEQIDVSDLTLRIAVPALVVHERFFRLTSFEICRQVAASIPYSRFISAADHDAVAEALADFIGPPDVEESIASSLATAWARETESGLSDREIEVLRLVAAGQTNQQIADALVISRNTVRRHVSNVFDKTGAANRTEASVFARDNGIA